MLDWCWSYKQITAGYERKPHPKRKKRKSKKLIYRDSGVAKSLKIFQIKQKKNHGYKKNIQK